MTGPVVGLRPEDLAEVMAKFGVAETQVRRDHAISHILAAISRLDNAGITFFGGTALSRTFLDHARLSEDIDLLTTASREVLVTNLTKTIDTALRRSHGRVSWSPPWTRNSDVEPAVVITPDGIAVKIQLLRAANYEPWPTQKRAIEQRYRDAPPAVLQVPTLPSFVGWKTAAWMDRGTTRDLYDLWALTKIGALNAESAALFARHGPTGSPPRSWMFEHAPSPSEWAAQLAEQTRLTVTAEEALNVVRTAWAAAVGEDWSPRRRMQSD